jgi:small subunit ribosomal protein S4
MLLHPGDSVEVRVKSKALEIVKGGGRSSWPWLQVDPMALKGSFLQYPERDQIPENIKENLIVELYSK